MLAERGDSTCPHFCKSLILKGHASNTHEYRGFFDFRPVCPFRPVRSVEPISVFYGQDGQEARYPQESEAEDTARHEPQSGRIGKDQNRTRRKPNLVLKIKPEIGQKLLFLACIHINMDAAARSGEAQQARNMCKPGTAGQSLSRGHKCPESPYESA
jgi:hypothetical protein